MAHFNSGITAVLLLTLTACGGGGDGPVVTPPPIDPPAPGDTGMWVTHSALLETYTDPTIYTALPNIPTNGSATYDGTFSGQLANSTDSVTDTLIGAMTVDVDFRATTVDVVGSVSDFVDSDDNALTGQLTLSAGSLDRGGNPSSDATLMMLANGTLRDAQGRDLIIGSQLEGDFLGAGHAAMGGAVLGSVQVNGIDQDFDGGFIAAR